MRVFYLNAMSELQYRDAEKGDRITVEYETNRSPDRQTISGEVVYVEINHANDSVISVWFVSDLSDRLYQLSESSISRTPEEYEPQEAAETLDDYSEKIDVKQSLTRLDPRSHKRDGETVSWVDVIDIEPQNDPDDYENMTDYELQAAALQEARQGSLSDAFDALLERQEQTHVDFMNAQAYGEDEQTVDKLRIRSDRLRTGLKDALDRAND